MRNFRDCIASAGFGHVKTMGARFTWINKRPYDLIQRRLDRILANRDWFQNFTEGIVHIKSRGLVDHSPVIIHVPMEVQNYSKQFQFFTFMTQPQFP